MSDVPSKLGLLPDEVAGSFLNAGVLQNAEPLPQNEIERASTLIDRDAEPVRELFDEAMGRFLSDERTAADAWLAPVLHATLRLTRREAADSGLWNYLALRLAPDYVYWRHLSREAAPTVARNRFVGPFHTQAFARLWWAAELFRDGPDYGPVKVACGNQDVLNTVLRLEVIRHRPTAQAIIRLLETGVVRTGREVNALAQAVNTAGTTLSYEALAPDEPRDTDAYRDWVEAADEAVVPFDRLPRGPEDGRIPKGSVDTLAKLFERLFVDSAAADATSEES